MSLRHQGLLPAITVAAVLAVVVLAWAPHLWSGSRRLSCTLLPDLSVPLLASPDGSCPLRAHDRIVSVEVAGAFIPVVRHADLRRRLPASGAVWLEVERGGARLQRQVPLVSEAPWRRAGRFVAGSVIAGVLLTLGILVFSGSTARAAVPLLIFHGSLAALLAILLSGRASFALGVAQLVAAGLVPASLFHLALTFPHERRVLRRLPQIVYLPYVACAGVVALQLAPFVGSSRQGLLLDGIFLGGDLAGWALLVASCVIARGQAASPVDRLQTDVLLRGFVAAPAAVAGLTLLTSGDRSASETARAGLAVLALPIPIAVAIARYQLFDLGREVRERIVHLLQLCVVAALIAVLWSASELYLDGGVRLDDPLIAFAWAFVGLLLSDPIRNLVRGLLDGWSPPRRRFLRRLAEEQIERLAELRPAEEQAAILCGAAALGLGARSAMLFARTGREWAVAGASEERMDVAPALVEAAVAGHPGSAPVHLARLADPAPNTPLAGLRDAGVEVLVPLRWGAQTLGCLVIGSARRNIPYGVEHLAFLRGIAARASVALQNDILVRDLVASERFATLGRVAAGLAHEIGKPLGVLDRLAQRLPERLGEPERAMRDAAAIHSLASEMHATVQGLLGAVQRESQGPAEGAPLPTETLLERAVTEVSRIHGAERVVRRFDPELPDLPARAEPLVRVVVNLLDNALRASPSGQVVELRASADSRELRIEVVDRGRGMSADLLRRAQQPFFSTRSLGSGSGLGLFVSRSILETLGGSLVLRSAPWSGTSALVSVPLAADDALSG